MRDGDGVDDEYPDNDHNPFSNPLLKVVAGTNYLLTVLVASSNCSADQQFDREQCTVVNKDER